MDSDGRTRRKEHFMVSVLERFLKYVSYDTQSESDAETVPSSKKQWELARELVKELEEIGAAGVTLSEHCYVYAEIPATSEREIPVIGFIAHMDTASEMSGRDVKPRIVRNYDGSDIVLNEEKGVVLSPERFESLKENIGKDLVVTDGTTLLGGDDKAGIAEIMAMAEYLLDHREIPHGTVKICFTPDEEVGRGVDFFDVEGFGAKYAYTVDGGAIGELEYENFNAAGARLTVQGSSIHPGSAKGQMKNALLLGMEFHSMLPVNENPAYTEGYEGFYHLGEMSGGVEEAQMSYIIRDHDRVKFEAKKNRFLSIASYLNEKYGEGTVTVSMKDSYYNMKEMVVPYPELTGNAVKAFTELGIEPKILPIRGGTDGARLSYMGLPCPNLGTGGHNCHGKYEYVSVQDMEKSVEVLLKIIEIFAK